MATDRPNSIIRVQHLAHGLGRKPEPGKRFASVRGMPLRAAIPDDSPIVLRPKERAALPTGVAMELPDSMEAQIRPLEDLGAKFGLMVLNSPGTIDPDYRSEIMVILINLGKKSVTIRRGDPIAMMTFHSFVRVRLELSNSLPKTRRATRGLGSTGTK